MDEREFQFHDLDIRVRRGSQLRSILTIYMFLGALGFILGLGYLLASRFLTDLSTEELIAAIASLGGGILAVASFAMTKWMKERDEVQRLQIEKFEAANRFLYYYHQLEMAVVEYAFPEALAEDRDPSLAMNMRDAVESLRARSRFRSEEIIQIENLMRLRNRIAHDAKFPDISVIEQHTRQASQLIDRIAHSA